MQRPSWRLKRHGDKHAVWTNEHLERNLTISVKNREYIYPVIITPKASEPHAFTVKILDIDGMTEGNSVSDPLDMAIVFVGAYSFNNELPPSNTNLPDRKNNQIISLIQVHPDKYKRKHDNKVIKNIYIKII